MLPPPMTTATWTSRAWTCLICWAMEVATPGSMPKCDSPISASPLSLSSTRPYFAVNASSLPLMTRKPSRTGFELLVCSCGRESCADFEPGEAPHDDVLAELCDRLVGEIANRQFGILD